MTSTSWERTPAERGPVELTVVVMAYNEAATLDATVREIVGALGSIPRPCEVVVIDDGSTDGTGAIGDRLAEELACVRVVHHRLNAGLGGVYRTGFREARGDLVTFFPADGQFPAGIIPEFWAAIRQADIVLGYLPARRGPLLGRALSIAERLAYRVLFGPLPRFQGIFLCRMAVVRELRLRSAGRGWAVVMELILRMRRGGYRVATLPTAMRTRTAGRSKVNNVRTIVANATQMLALRYGSGGPYSSMVAEGIEPPTSGM